VCDLGHLWVRYGEFCIAVSPISRTGDILAEVDFNY